LFVDCTSNVWSPSVRCGSVVPRIAEDPTAGHARMRAERLGTIRRSSSKAQRTWSKARKLR
jgi:hypothetical protein